MLFEFNLACSVLEMEREAYVDRLYGHSEENFTVKGYIVSSFVVYFDDVTLYQT